MSCGRYVQSGLRTVMAGCLCLLVVSAAPVSQAVLGEVGPPSDPVTSEQALALLHVLRSVLDYPSQRQSDSQELQLPESENVRTSKRGFGIAGLDNVDMITSTLDRSRSMLRPRHRPVMSSGLTLHQLRELMAKAG